MNKILIYANKPIINDYLFSRIIFDYKSKIIRFFY